MAHDVQELAEEAQHGRVKEDPGGTYGDGSTQTMISNHFQSERGGGVECPFTGCFSVSTRVPCF